MAFEETGIIDEEAALENLDGERELLSDLASFFCEDTPSMLDQFELAVARQEQSTAQRLAHSLKGQASNFYAEAAVSAALKMESEIANGQISRISSEQIDALRQAFARVTRELKRLGWVS